MSFTIIIFLISFKSSIGSVEKGGTHTQRRGRRKGEYGEGMCLVLTHEIALSCCDFVTCVVGIGDWSSDRDIDSWCVLFLFST